MDISRYSSASSVPFHGFLWLSLKLKTLMFYGLLAIVAVNNSPAPTQAQALNQSPSTSPSYVAPKGGITTLDTPSCSNSISFSEYPSGTAINTQYSNKGIVFGGSSPFITTDGANPTSPVLSGSPQFVGAIEGTFVNPRDGVTPAVATNFQLDAGYFDSVGSTSLKLYDTQGNLIEQRTNTGQGIFKFSVEGLPVAKWRIESVGDEPAGFAIDNVCFTLQQVKQSPRQYPDYLREGDTLEGVPETDFPASEGPLPDYFVPAVTPQLQDEEDYFNQEEVPNSPTNADSTPINSDAVPIGPPTPAEQSCDGIGTPLTQNRLFQLAKQINPKATAFRIREAFENFALESQLLRKYDKQSFKSPERFNKTGYRKRGRLAGVKPEAVSTPFVINFAPYGYGPPIPIPYPNSTFWEAKSIREGKKIELKTGEYQIQGYLDYLSHYSTAALATVPKNEHPNGHLVLMTTSDVGVTKGVLDYAGETPGVPFTPVAVYHMVACEKDTSKVSTENYLQMGRGILLNGNRFTGYPVFIHSPLPAGSPSSLKFLP